MKDNEFDMEAFRKEAIAKLQAGEGLLGDGGAFTPLLKAFSEKINDTLFAILPDRHIYESNYRLTM